MPLAPSRFGFSQTPLPALCRQAALWAWRPRQRKIPDPRSAEATAGGYLRPTSAAGTPISRSRSSILGKLWWPSLPTGAHGVQRSPVPTRATCYARCGLGGKCAQHQTLPCILRLSRAYTSCPEFVGGRRAPDVTHSGVWKARVRTAIHAIACFASL